MGFISTNTVSWGCYKPQAKCVTHEISWGCPGGNPSSFGFVQRLQIFWILAGLLTGFFGQATLVAVHRYLDRHHLGLAYYMIWKVTDWQSWDLAYFWGFADFSCSSSPAAVRYSRPRHSRLRQPIYIINDSISSLYVHNFETVLCAR